MPLKAYEEFAQEPLAFPIGGKSYVVPPLGFTDGIRLQRILIGQDESLNDAPPEAAWELILGSAFEEMCADKVPMEAVARAGFTAMTDFQFGREQAERVWESGLDPKALADAIRGAEKQLASQRSNSTGAARRTRTRASSTGTTSRPTTKREPVKAKRSRSST